MADGKCTITIDGSYPGEYIVPCNQVSFIEENTLINYSNSTIYLYKSLGNSYPRIALQFNSLPIYQTGTTSGNYTISNITTTNFNLQSQIYRYGGISNVLIFTAILFCGIALMIRRKL